MLNVPLLRESLDRVMEREPLLTRRFYEILFERFPQARPLFGGNSSDRQHQMLQEALVAVLDHIEDADWLTRTLGALGAKHNDYGVTQEMYAWVGESLIATLAEISGADWTDAHTAAWSAAYGAIAQMMQAGAAAAAA